MGLCRDTLRREVRYRRVSYVDIRYIEAPSVDGMGQVDMTDTLRFRDLPAVGLTGEHSTTDRSQVSEAGEE